MPHASRPLPHVACSMLFCLCALLSLAAIGCQPGRDDERPSLSLQLNWFPEAEHGGFYAAQVHGYFAQEGLSVDILPGGPNVPVVQSLDTGRVDFAVMNADRVVFAQDAGADLVALMTPMQNSPRCIMVHRESGITSLQQLRDVTLAVGSGPAFYKYMAHQLPLENVETVAYPGSVALFLNDPRLAQQAYVFSEPYLAQQQGADPVSLMVSDLGYNPYASSLVVQRAFMEQQPVLMARFVRSVVRGWRHYLEQPDETNRVIQKLNQDMTPGVLSYGVQEIAKLCGPLDSPEVIFGAMTRDRWQTLVDQLSEIGLIETTDLDPGRMFTNEFLTAEE